MIKSKKVKKALKVVKDQKLSETRSELQKLKMDHEMLQKEHDFEKREHKMTKAQLKSLERKNGKKTK